MEDFIIRKRKNGNQTEKYYRAACPKCGKDKGYVRKARLHNRCAGCAGRDAGQSRKGQPGPNLGRKFSEATVRKMSLAKKGCTPWNKGKSATLVARQNMSQARQGVTPANKGQSISLEQRIKLSCINRNVDINSFDGFTTEGSKAERNKLADMQLYKQCFERDHYICDVCRAGGCNLHAHHLNSWKYFPEQRFDVSNMVTLCGVCHKRFHATFGNGKHTPNTKEQFVQFKEAYVPVPIKIVYLLTGASASGKSWVLQNTTTLHPLDLDNNTIKSDIQTAVDAVARPIIAITVGVSTFIKTHPSWVCRLIVIQEDRSVIEQRLRDRGGNITATMERRIKRMTVLSQRAVFTGTSSEVLQFINSL